MNYTSNSYSTYVLRQTLKKIIIRAFLSKKYAKFDEFYPFYRKYIVTCVANYPHIAGFINAITREFPVNAQFADFLLEFNDK